MVEDPQRLAVRKVVEEIRVHFARSDWNETVEAYDGGREQLKPDRAARLEAACLAARAWIGLKDRSRARGLLMPLGKVQYKKPAHYELLARTFLDLKQYGEAAAACQSAHRLRQIQSETGHAGET